MELKLQRLKDNGISTIGELTVDDLKFVTLEDTYRPVKIKGQTRIPAGIYEIILRKYGSHNAKYLKKFKFHKGMLELLNVPEFKNILIHIGNRPEDTEGFILVGEKEGEGMILNSTQSYIKLYRHVVDYLLEGNELYITIIDN